MKTGRKPNHYVGPDGLPVAGLARLPSGRWRIIGTNVRFTEPDERKAIEHFHRLKGTDDGRLLAEQRAKAMLTRPNVLAPDERQMFSWVADQIRIRPLYAAQQMGIEQIGYLDRLPRPETLPTLDELETLWQERATCSKGQKRKVLRAWENFRSTTGIGSLRDITGRVTTAFQDAIYGRNLSVKEQSHIFAGVKRLLKFAKDRHVAEQAIESAISHLRSLKPSDESAPANPNPVSVEDWQKLLAAASGRDRAQILLMLNGAYYSGEVVDVKWKQIRDGAIIGNRKKKGKYVRICTLWPETKEAIDALPRIPGCDHIFTTYQRVGLTPGGAHDCFNALAERAKVPHVTGSQLRDGAASAAADAQISSLAIDTLLGHSSGMTDKYAKRTAATVRSACDAVYRKYFGSHPE